MALTAEQRKHPAQVALNQLPDGWESRTDYYVDVLPDRLRVAGDRLLALMRSTHDAGSPWTVGRILRYLRDWQSDVAVKMVAHAGDHVPMFLMGGKWIEYTYPERDLIVERYRFMEAERRWKLAVKGVDKKVLTRARMGAEELMAIMPGMSLHRMVLRDDVCQWLQEWGARNGYDTGMGE